MRRSPKIILSAIILLVLCLLCGCKEREDAVKKQPSQIPSTDETVLPTDELGTDGTLPEEKPDADRKPQEPSGSEAKHGSIAPNSPQGELQEPAGGGTQSSSTEKGNTGEEALETSAREPIILPEIELN